MNKLASLLTLLLIATAPFAEEVNNPVATDSVEKISLDDATHQILKEESEERVLGATTENVDGRIVHIIKVLTPNGHIKHYAIDAETGAVKSE